MDKHRLGWAAEDGNDGFSCWEKSKTPPLPGGDVRCSAIEHHETSWMRVRLFGLQCFVFQLPLNGREIFWSQHVSASSFSVLAKTRWNMVLHGPHGPDTSHQGKATPSTSTSAMRPTRRGQDGTRWDKMAQGEGGRTMENDGAQPQDLQLT
jgi:hypothetical protein